MQKSKEASRFNIIKTDDYIVDGELIEGDLFLHFDFLAEKFTKGMYAKLLEDWIDGTEQLKREGFHSVYSNIPKDDDKVNKWQRMFGLVPFYETDTNYIYGGVL